MNYSEAILTDGSQSSIKKPHNMFRISTNFVFAGHVGEIEDAKSFTPTSCKIMRRDPELPYFPYNNFTPFTTVFRSEDSYPLLGIPILTDLTDDEIFSFEGSMEAWICVYSVRYSDIVIAFVTSKDDSLRKLTKNDIKSSFISYLRRISEILYDGLDEDKIEIQRWESVSCDLT